MRNANDGISTLQIIDGGMNNICKMLDRMRTLATQSASGHLHRRPRRAEHGISEPDYGNRPPGAVDRARHQRPVRQVLSVFIGGGKAAGTGNIDTSQRHGECGFDSRRWTRGASD